MFYLKQKYIKKQLIIFSFCLILFLLTGCVKQQHVVIDNQKSEIINKNEDKKTEIKATENKDETDKINTEKNNEGEEEVKINWKKYINPLYGFSFEYPDYLKITADESCDDPSMGLKGCWQIQIESTDYLKGRVPEKRQGAGALTEISGFYLSIVTHPVNNMTIEEFRDSRQFFGPGEWKESNSRKFFISGPAKPDSDRPDNFDLFAVTLYNPNLIISMNIMGIKEKKEEAEIVFDHLMKSLN